MNKSIKLQQLEAKFGLAENLINELSTTIDDISTTEVEVYNPENGELKPVIVDEEIMNVTTLKQDFMLLRNNFIRLINTGQRILESATVLDISDLKPSHLEALSNLQTTLGTNMRMMMDLYESIAKIEKSRQKAIPKGSMVEQNSGTINTNNTNVFVADSASLLKLLNEQEDKDEPIVIN